MTFVVNHDVTPAATRLDKHPALEHALSSCCPRADTQRVLRPTSPATALSKEDRVGGDDAVRPEFTAPLMGSMNSARRGVRLHIPVGMGSEAN